jgi:hypothetical protein
MRFILLIVVFCILGNYQLKAQDSISFTKDFRLYEGIYLSYQDFRYNWPISKEKIITTINKEQLDFYSNLVEQNVIECTERDGSVVKVNPENIFGYCQNNIIFINKEGNFFRIPVFGAISNFIGTVEVVNYSPGFDPFMNAPMNSTARKTQEIRQYLFDFYSGEIAPFSLEKLEAFLKRDDAIFKEYSLLNKKKKKEFATKYIRMYNEKHVVYFPKD